MKKPSHVMLFALGLSVALNTEANESWWPQFRGPNCSGVAKQARPPVELAPGTNQLWKTAVPAGSSSPCIWGGRIFLTAFEDGKLWTQCYQRQNGRLLWQREAKTDELEEFHATEGSPAASTPATDGERVVSYFGSFGLICHDFGGKELWQHRLPVAQTAGSFGSGGSPVIADGLVLVNRDQMKNCSLLAADLRTGKKVWETGRPDVSQSFGTPMIWNNDGTTEIVMSGSLKLKAYDPKTGAERWSLAGMPSFTCTTPVAGGDLLYFAGWSPGKEAGSGPTWAGLVQPADKDNDNVVTLEEAKAAHFDSYFKSLDQNGDGKITPEDLTAMQAQMAKGENVLIAIKSGGKGELTASHVEWKQTRGLPYVPSPLLYEDRIYLIKDGGMVSSHDAKTGKTHYQQERLNAIGNYYSSPVAANGNIYVASLNGRVTVFAAGGATPKIRYQADFGERISATPAMAGEAIYYRTATALYAFGK